MKKYMMFLMLLLTILFSLTACQGAKDDENQNNELHFTSAALSQVGYEVANAFSSVSKIEIVNKPK